MKNSLVIVCLFLLLFTPMSGQLITVFDHSDAFEQRQMLSRSSFNQIPLKIMPSLDIERILQEDEEAENEGLLPPSTGYGIEVNYSLEDGIWEFTPTQRKWSMRVKSEGATYLTFIFSEIKLIPGAELYVYNKEGSMLFGPVTPEYILSDSYTTSMVSGEEAILQLLEPIHSEVTSVILISHVIHGYKDIFESNVISTRGVGDADPCHIDLMCYPEYEPYGNGVVRFSFYDPIEGRDRNGSGAILNNTSKDGKFYLLTAFHNLDIDDGSTGVLTAAEIARAEREWRIYFRFQRNCGPSAGPSSQMFSGGHTFKAAWVGTDFALLELGVRKELMQVPVSYLGWDRRTINPSNGVGIHHPRGDYKKISIANSTITSHNGVINWSGNINTAPNTHWKVNFDVGGIEKGSSGSPLLNESGNVIGQAHGGHEGICNRATKYYGKFDLSWDGGGTPSTRLKDWLDPGNRETLFLGMMCSTSNFSLTGEINQMNCSGDPNIINQPLIIGGDNVVNNVCPGLVKIYTNSLDLRVELSLSTVGATSNFYGSNGIYYIDFAIPRGQVLYDLVDECGNSVSVRLVARRYMGRYISGSKKIVIDFNEEETSTYRILLTNISGSVVKTVNTSDTHTEIDVSDISSGLHYMTIYDHNNEIVGTEKYMMSK